MRGLTPGAINRGQAYKKEASMIAPGTFTKRPIIVLRAMERRGVAFLHSLVETCREWPELRQWLLEDFGRREETRENFKALIDGPNPDGSQRTLVGLADLAGEAGGMKKERDRLQRVVNANAPRIYGGRTWQELEQLVYRYEGGVTELGVFVLTRQWHMMDERAKFAPELQRAGAEFLDGVIRKGEKHLLANLTRAVELLNRSNRSETRDALGHSDWWKLQVTLFMLRNPQPAYRTREVRAYLGKLGINISSLDFRRFSNRHGIRRDMRAGRPRTKRCLSDKEAYSSRRQ